MKELTQHIQEKIAARKFCTIFQKHVDVIHPIPRRINKELQKAIEDFAAANGWTATIVDTGVRVTLRPLKE